MTQEPNPNELEPRRAAQGFFCVAHLGEHINRLANALTSKLSPALMLKYARLVGRMARTINQTSAYNHSLALKRNMMARPSWRARVLRDLGGECALIHWERRRDHIKNVKRHNERFAQNLAPPALPRPDYQAPKRAPDKPAKHGAIITDRFRVDAEGQFRLAPLQRAAHSRRASPRYSRGNRHYSARPTEPITLIPSELRPRALKAPAPHYAPSHNTSSAMDVYARPAERKAPP